MNDTLRYFAKEGIVRRHHHSDLTFGMLYQYAENFVTVFSHDEVVHGKASLLFKMGAHHFKPFCHRSYSIAFLFSCNLGIIKPSCCRRKTSQNRKDWQGIDHLAHVIIKPQKSWAREQFKTALCSMNSKINANVLQKINNLFITLDV